MKKKEEITSSRNKVNVLVDVSSKEGSKQYNLMT